MFTFIPSALAEDAAAETAPSWFETAFEKFGEFPVWGWIIVAVLLIGGFAAYRLLKGEHKTVWNARTMALGALCMALSCVLSMIRLWQMPQGGSVTPASMLPLMLFAYVYGAGPGVALGALYGVLQFILNPWIVSVPQVLLDYPVAFGMLGLAGLFGHMKNDLAGLTMGVVVASAGRFLAALASGVVFFADYAAGSGLSPLVYSIVYNGTYMGPECIICLVLVLMMGPRLVREMRKNK